MGKVLEYALDGVVMDRDLGVDFVIGMNALGMWVGGDILTM
jgi:hypothetical protein